MRRLKKTKKNYEKQSYALFDKLRKRNNIAETRLDYHWLITERSLNRIIFSFFDIEIKLKDLGCNRLLK